MSETARPFVWYELMTSDLEAAEAFYREVVGWTTQDASIPGMRYTTVSAGDTSIAGMMTLPKEVSAGGGRPGWIGYIDAADVDADANRLAQAGGAIHRPAEDIPTVGRFAIVADPQGASFVLFRLSSGETPAPVAPGTPGFVGWHELQTTDLDSAFAFYAAQFGWTKGQGIDMGAMGTYQIFEIGGTQSGGMMNKMPEVPHPFWLYYFNVDGIGAAAERVKSAGGQIVAGPQEVPGGSWIINAIDPQGAMFALVSMKQ